MVKAAKHPNIKLYTNADVVETAGITGNYTITIRQKPRYVDPKLCTGCGACVAKCPIDVPDGFNRNFGMRKAVYIPFSQAVPKVALIDKAACMNCGLCAKACQRGAVNYDDKETRENIIAGAIIVATGWDEFPVQKFGSFGYGKYQNVITQMELERMLSPVGPTHGHVLRVSDKKIPKRVAMIQCVGSRSMHENANPYCSSVCCNLALKNAQLLKQEIEGSDVVIFYMDMRCWDKQNEEYYRRIREKGVMFVRGIPGDVKEDQKTGDVILTYENTLEGTVQEVAVDLLVLSAGMVPSAGTGEITAVLGLDKSPGGFLKEIHLCLSPQETKSAGIFIAGCASGPKNIPYSVSSALAAAASASTIVTSSIFSKELVTAEVDKTRCIACHRCEKSCNYDAIHVSQMSNIAEVNDLDCKGCGICISSCPARAIALRYYRENQISNKVYAILKERTTSTPVPTPSPAPPSPPTSTSPDTPDPMQPGCKP
jgi:heterodisulfide reductase subunit A